MSCFVAFVADHSHDFQERSEAYGKGGKGELARGEGKLTPVWAPAQLQAAEQAQRWTYGW